MKRILIVGANGYIGARLSFFFSRQKNYHVTALSHSANGDQTKQSATIENIVGDIRDAKLITKLATMKFNVVINLVSLDHHHSNGDPALVSGINVTPTWSLLDAFVNTGLDQYIYFSTVQVYGRLSSGLIQETYPATSANAYGLTHALSENICDYFNRNSSIACTVLRLSNSYGSPVSANNGCWSLVINQLCKSAFEQNLIKLLSDGTPLRDFIHGADICSALKLLMEVENIESKKDIYNLCSGYTLTIMELAVKVQKVYEQRYGMNLPIEGPSDDVLTDIDYYISKQRYSLGNEKLKKLNFEPMIDLDQGINELFNYLERNDEW